LTIPQWIGWTGLGVITTVMFGIAKINKSSLDKKVDKEVFEEHKRADDLVRESINTQLKKIDENVSMLVKHHVSKDK